MAEQLEIVIGANVDDAKAGIQDITKVIDQFGKQGKLSIGVIEQALVQLRATIKQTTNPADLQKLNLAFTALQQKLTQLKNEGGLAQNLGGISRSARLAHSDIDQLSRDLQLFASGNERAGDALSNLVFTFERLRGTAGGTRAAISALGSAFLGPAGIIIGVSTALNLLSPFIEKLFSSGETAKKVKQDILNFGDAVARLGAEAAAQSVAPLEKYKVALTDLDVPMQQRLQALKDYNKEADKSNQLQQTDLSNIEKVNIAIGNQVELLERRALIKGAEEKLVELYKTIFENEFKIQNAVERTNIKFKDQADAFANLVNKGDAKKFTQDIFNLGKAANTLGGFDKLQNLTFPLEKAKEQVNNLLNFIDAEIKKGGVFKIDVAPEIKLTDAQRAIIEFAKFQSQLFNIPVPLRFEITDDSKTEFKKAQDIIKGIEDHTIRLKFISLTETGGIQAELKNIQIPKLKLRVDDAGFKESINTLVKGLVIPVSAKLDEASLVATEDEIKKVFSGFSDTNIFTEAGRNAGTKFREALLESVKIFDKGFAINPNIDVTQIIDSLTTSLSGIKDIQLKVIKTETFDNAIRTLRDLHDAGVEAGQAVEDAFLKAGKSSEDAAAAGLAITKAYGGITKQTEDVARSVNDTLTPAFTNLFDAIIKGENPLKAFFQSIGQSLEQLAAKLIGSEIEKAILSLLSVTSGVTAAITATTTATVAASAAGTAAAATAGVAAAASAAAATSAAAAAAAAIIAAAAAKAALAAINPLAFLGLIGFAEGGEPPVNKPSIVGEKGWELFIPKVPGTIVSHEDSVNLLTKASMSSSSVKEHETIREYLIATKVAQQLKEHFSYAFRSIENTIKTVTASHEKLISYSYKLHESVTSLKETIASEKTNNNFYQSVSSIIKEFSSSDKQTLATISEVIQKIIPYAKPTEITSKETVATIVKGDNESSHYENFIDRIEKVIVNNLTSTGITDKFSTETNYFTKLSEQLKERFASDKSSSERDSNKESSYEILSKLLQSEKYYYSVSSAIEKLSIANNSSEVTDSIHKLHEKISTINNSTELSSSIDKLHEKISERSDKSVTIERIINNNFFSSDSFKETFKSMSLTDLQKTFHIPAFAQGGAVFGPTLAILGEGFGISRGNPEFVGTRSQLSGIQGGQFDVNVNVDGELSFDMGKLAIALNRNQRSSFRTSGKPGF